MATSFENFVNTELPKRIATNESPTTPQAGDIPVFSGVGLLTESKTASEAGLATEAFATNAANTAETSAKSYADDLITSIYKFQTTYNPQTTGNFPTTANTVGGVAIKKGFTWVVSGVTGQYTFQGVTVDNGDTLLALVDNASATSAADWHITEKNLGYTPENSSNKYSNNDLAGGVGTYPATPNVKAYVDNGLSGKQNTLADVITANTYGSSTQYPVITFNTKGIATGVTLQTVSVAEVSDNVFRIKDNDDATKKIAFEASGIAAGQTRTINMPDFDVDLNKAVYRKDLSMSVALSSLRAGDEIDLTVSTITVSMQHSDTFSTVKGYYFNNNTQSAVTFTLSRSLGTASPTILTNIDGVTGETLSSQDFNVTTTAFNHIVYIPRYGRLLISPGSSGQVRLVVYSPQGNSISANNSLWCESTTLAGFHNTAIKCKDLKIHANQKFGRFEDLWGFPLTSQLPGATSPANGILVPIGTKMRGFKGNSVVGSTSGCRVEAVFTRTVVGATGSVVTMSDSDGITPYSHMASWSGGDPITEHYITLRSGNAYLLILYTVGPDGGSGVTVGSTTLHSVGTLPAVSVSISGGRLTASFTVPSQAYYTYEIRSVYGVDL